MSTETIQTMSVLLQPPVLCLVGSVVAGGFGCRTSAHTSEHWLVFIAAHGPPALQAAGDGGKADRQGTLREALLHIHC